MYFIYTSGLIETSISGSFSVPHLTTSFRLVFRSNPECSPSLFIFLRSEMLCSSYGAPSLSFLPFFVSPCCTTNRSPAAGSSAHHDALPTSLPTARTSHSPKPPSTASFTRLTKMSGSCATRWRGTIRRESGMVKRTALSSASVDLLLKKMTLRTSSMKVMMGSRSGEMNPLISCFLRLEGRFIRLIDW